MTDPLLTSAPAGAPLAGDERLLDAARWALWQTLARGIAHALANAAQLLTLDPPPAALLAQARARVSRAHALVALAVRPADGPASFLPAVLADFDALQQLQAGLPAAAVETDVEDPLPMTAIPEADLLHALLLVTTRLKEASEAALALQVRAVRDGAHVRVDLTAAAAGPADAPSATPNPLLLEAAAVLLARAGGALAESDRGWELRLPVLAR